MIRPLRLSLCFFLLNIPLNAQKLVDYTDNQVTRSRPKVQSKSSVKPRPSSSSGSSRSWIQSELSFFNMNPSINNGEAQVNGIELQVDFDTYDQFFFNLNYRNALSFEGDIWQRNAKSNKSGPFTGTLGFHWLQFDPGVNQTDIDLITGYRLGNKNSLLTSSRNEAFLGLTTSKRFSEFALGLGYTYHMPSTPQDPLDQEIGAVNVISASLGYRAQNNIHFLLEGKSYRIDRSDRSDDFGLRENLSFSSLSPQMVLKVGRKVQLKLAALFQVERLNSLGAERANLWEYPGAYGNLLSAGLNFSI